MLSWSPPRFSAVGYRGIIYGRILKKVGKRRMLVSWTRLLDAPHQNVRILPIIPEMFPSLSTPTHENEYVISMEGIVTPPPLPRCLPVDSFIVVQ